jgi:tetratricopeptide (TPR) repeat protein
MPRRTSSFAVLLTLGLLWAVGASAEVEQSDPRLDAAIAVYRQDGADKALPEFERLARLFRHSTQRHDEAAALRYTGECHWRLGNFREARSYLDRALTLDRASGDRLALGKTLNVLGLLEWDLGHYDQAIGVFKRAGTLGRELGDKRLEGASLNNLSLVYDELGDYQTSLQQYHQVLDLYRGADIPRGLVGDTLGNLGGTHLLLGRYREALDYYRQALKISEALQSTASMSQDHGNIALCLLGLGQVDQALGHFDLAIDLAAQAGMQQDRAYWLLGKGNGLVQKGRYGKGLEYQREALAVYEKLGAQAELGEALYDMGRLYLLLGDADSAEEYFSRALNSARSIGLSRAVTLNLIALGDLQFRGAQFEAATALYDQARQRSAQSDERQHLAQSLLRLALAHRQLQQLKPASDEVAQALTLSRQIGARLVEAEALFAQAELDRLRQRFTAALAGFIAAEAAQAQIGDPDLLWQIDFSRARTYEALGNKTAAIGLAMCRTSTRSIPSWCGCSWNWAVRRKRSRPPSACARVATPNNCRVASRPHCLRRINKRRPSYVHGYGSCNARSEKRSPRGDPPAGHGLSTPTRTNCCWPSRSTRALWSVVATRYPSMPPSTTRPAQRRFKPGSPRAKGCWNTWSARTA